MAENDDFEELDIEIEPTVRTRPLSAERCLVEASLSLSIDDAARAALRSDALLTAAVQVPNSTWVRPVKRVFDRMSGADWQSIVRFEKPTKFQKVEDDAFEIAKSLAEGRSIAYIAPADLLPGEFVRAADLVIKVRACDREVLARAIARYLDAGPVDPSKLTDATALTLTQASIAFRPSATPAEISARIAKMCEVNTPAFGDDVPLLQDAPEFGEFRTWGLEAIRSYQEFTENRSNLTFSQIENSAILFGQPGHGKTTAIASFARSINAAALISTSIADLFSNGPGFLDSCIKESIAIFDRAEALVASGKSSGDGRPVVILIDELDALPSRIGLDARSLSWWSALIAQWLLLCSKPRENIFLFGCTNHLERVDPALRRPGRFGRCIEMKAADAAGVLSITRRHLRGALADVDLAPFVDVAGGRSAAEIMQVVKTAKSRARLEARALRIDDLISAALPSGDLSPADRRLIAIHEAGHVTTALAVDGDHVVSAAIGGTDGALGATTFSAATEIVTRETREKAIIVILGGRAAELIERGVGSGNASDDLATATSLVASMFLTEGLGASLIHFGTTESLQHMLRADVVVRAEIDKTLNGLMDRAVDVLRRHRGALNAIARELEARLFISGDRARALFAENPPEETPACSR
ncbi:MAG: hypothetical protein CFE29_08860 [Bradyrhizobiaceae bacterium PARB1]|nr:MAG: hypothetical protein CFE29_08860 [Bradyrhizobiaceae bacterium PARB1]